jgi:hypothetical protein
VYIPNGLTYQCWLPDLPPIERLPLSESRTSPETLMVIAIAVQKYENTLAPPDVEVRLFLMLCITRCLGALSTTSLAAPISTKGMYDKLFADQSLDWKTSALR